MYLASVVTLLQHSLILVVLGAREVLNVKWYLLKNKTIHYGDKILYNTVFIINFIKLVFTNNYSYPYSLCLSVCTFGEGSVVPWLLCNGNVQVK